MRKRFIISSTILVAIVLWFIPTSFAEGEHVSRFGEYSGYSAPIYNGYERVSQYVTVQEGTAHETRLAVDLLMPTLDGRRFSDLGHKLPVIWAHVPYHRANKFPNGFVLNWLMMSEPWALELMNYGYVVALVDIRGTGASYGVKNTMWSENESKDAYDITEWLAAQDWSTGKVGMFGYSYLGTDQYFTAAEAPPSLKCIFPRQANFDTYDFFYQNGAFLANSLGAWDMLTTLLDLNLIPDLPTAPVDEDPDGSLLAAAIAEHSANINPLETFGPSSSPYRDSVDPHTGEQLHYTRSVSSHIDEINQSGVAIYHWGKWLDHWTRDTLYAYANMTVPQKLAMTPGFHHQIDVPLLLVEHLRWYDYWLKGIDNGIMNEAPIHYAVINAPEEQKFQSARVWPPLVSIKTRLFFNKGTSGTVNSVNDGRLTLVPSFPQASDEYTVDYTATSGPPTRWSTAAEPPGSPVGYPDMTPNDEKGLTYTTDALPDDVQAVGTPVIKMWVTSTYPDGNFIAYLEDIDEAGFSNYVTEGAIKASDRALSDAPFDTLGAPWHRGYAEDQQNLPSGEPAELVFDMLPVSYIFQKGHHIRITVVGADQSTYPDAGLNPAPVVHVYRDLQKRSRLELPVKVTPLR